MRTKRPSEGCRRVLTRAFYYQRIVPYGTTPTTPWAYLPDPNLVQLTGPSGAWGPLVLATSGGSPDSIHSRVPLWDLMGFACWPPCLLASVSPLHGGVWSCFRGCHKA